MDGTYQVILLLKLLVLVGPVAVYFIVLGLLNSQPSPRLINARQDFLLLTVVVCPALLTPIPALWSRGYGSVLLPALALAALAMWALLPAADSGWVVYNLSAARARALAERALRGLGWRYRNAGGTLLVEDRGLEIRFSSLPVLRNVTLHLSFADQSRRAETAAALRDRLDADLARQQLLPSLAGSCLMLLGVGLMILPLWMMTRHSDAIAQVVSRLLLS